MAYFIVHKILVILTDGAASEELDGQDDVSAATHWLLPAAEIEGLWENLVFDRYSSSFSLTDIISSTIWLIYFSVRSSLTCCSMLRLRCYSLLLILTTISSLGTELSSYMVTDLLSSIDVYMH